MNQLPLRVRGKGLAISTAILCILQPGTAAGEHASSLLGPSWQHTPCKYDTSPAHPCEGRPSTHAASVDTVSSLCLSGPQCILRAFPAAAPPCVLVAQQSACGPLLDQHQPCVVAACPLPGAMSPTAPSGTLSQDSMVTRFPSQGSSESSRWSLFHYSLAFLGPPRTCSL